MRASTELAPTRPGRDRNGAPRTSSGVGASVEAGVVPHAEPATEHRIESLVQELLGLLGEDPDRPGLRDTPERAARALRWLTSGYGRTAEDAIGRGVFEERHGSMVLVRDIELYSLCEHHLLPFFGHAHVAYVPDGHILGLSKVARVVDVFARRLQVQERLTDQVAVALEEALRPAGVAVIIEASHMCMMMRGVEKQASRTITMAKRGVFAESGGPWEEFLRLVG